MDIYFLTAEFWKNVFHGVFMELIVVAGIAVIILLIYISIRIFMNYEGGSRVWIKETVGSTTKWRESTEDNSGGCGCLLLVALVGIPMYVWSHLEDLSGNMNYECLKAGKLGPVVILRQEAPLLYNNYIEMDRMIDEEAKRVQTLEKQKSTVNSSSAKKSYEAQIRDAKGRQMALNNMQQRINNIATDMYFSSYLQSLEQDSSTPDFQNSLNVIKQECDNLMKLHSPSHD